jgi:hypothetical protein
MKNSCFYFVAFTLVLLAGCKKNDEPKSTGQILSSVFGLDRVTDFTNSDVLILSKEEFVNDNLNPIPESYVSIMMFGSNGSGNNSSYQVNQQMAVYAPNSDTYYNGSLTPNSSGQFLCEYLKGSASASVGDFQISIEKPTTLKALANFNIEAGLPRTSDLNITWTPDQSLQGDVKVIIGLCTGGVPCLLYETTDSGNFTIETSDLLQSNPGTVGNIFLTRVQLSEHTTDNGSILKVVKASSARSFTFDVL